MWDCCRWLHHMKKLVVECQLLNKKKKKGPGLIRGRKKVERWSGSRRFVVTQVNVRHFKHLLLLRLYLPPQAAGEQAEDAACSGLVLGSTEPQWSDSSSENSKNKVPESKGFFLLDFCFISKRHDSSETVRQWTGRLTDLHGSCFPEAFGID